MNLLNIIFFIISFFSFLKADFSDTLSYYQKFNIALDSYNLGRYKLAQNQFSNIISLNNDFDPTSSLMIAYSMYNQKKYDGAIEVIEKLLLEIDNTSYEIHSRLLLSDIYLSRGSNSLAFKNYLYLRPMVEDSLLINDIDQKLISCISYDLIESQIENLLIREKNKSNRSIINFARAYIAWLNADSYTLKNALDGIKISHLNKPYLFAYQNLKAQTEKKLTIPVTIGIVLPLSGLEQQKGQSYLSGLNHYLQTAGDNSFFRLIVYNTESNSIEALKIVKNIQSKSFIRGIIGPLLYDEILAISGFKSMIPILIPNSGPSGLAEISPNLFFLSPSPNIIAERTAEIMINHFNFKNIAVLSSLNKESKLITEHFLNECNQLGVNPVAVEWYSEKPENLSKQFKNIRKIAWDLVPDNVNNADASMNIDSLDALFDVDVTDFFSFPENEDIMDKIDSTKIILETIEAIYIPLNKGDLTYIGTQFPVYNLNTIIFGNENWLEMDILKQESIGPHIEGIKIISGLSSKLLSSNHSLSLNYSALAIDHANFLEEIIKTKVPNKRKYNLDIYSLNIFNGDNTSILFQGQNRNTNGAVQILEYKKKLSTLGYFDGINIIKLIK